MTLLRFVFIRDDVSLDGQIDGDLAALDPVFTTCDRMLLAPRQRLEGGNALRGVEILGYCVATNLLKKVRQT